MTENSQTGVSRRTVARGAAWAVPAIAVTAAAPAVAASNKTARFRVNWGPANGASWTSSKTFTATNIDNQCPNTTYQVTISTRLEAGEATNRNFTIGTQGLQANTECHRVNFSPASTFSATPILVLNHSGYHQSGVSGSGDCGWNGTQPRQTLTFTVRDAAGNEVATTNALVGIKDLSSAGGNDGKGGMNYWDSIMFPNSPDTTTSGLATNGNAGTQLNSSAGIGPYYVNRPNAASGGFDGWVHQFRMPNGVPATMLYTEHNAQWGNQFIGVAEVEFDAPCA